jgi:cyclophilin family peptidyl-prolyl cis-trans isomerase/chitodextrinase
MNRATIRRLSACILLGLAAVGCQLDSLLPIVGRQPPAIIPTNPADPTLQRAFTVDLRDYPEAQRLSWDFGDGAASVNLPLATGRAVIHDYANGGTYLVSVHLFTDLHHIDGSGSQWIASGSLPVQVTGPNVDPKASFRVQDVLDELGNPLALSKSFDGSRSSDVDGSIVSYNWDFGDGKTGVGKIVEHTYAVSARYVVRLTVVDDRGGQDSTTRTILVNTLPVASFTFAVEPGDGLTYTFDASGSTDADGPIAEYRWTFGDDSGTQTGQVLSHHFAVPDNYTVMLTVVDGFGAAISTSQTVDVTGTELFVRSIAPDFGVVDTTVSDAVIDGENFKDGATVRLEQGGSTIAATSVTFSNATTLHVGFDLSGAALGLYTLVVENPGGATASKADAFRVVSPNHVRLTTSKGDVLLELVDDAPITTANFLQYVDETFYDGTIFHRVVAGFVIQGGGILPDGTPKPGEHAPIQNEFSPARSNVRGTVAMAKKGNDPNSATNQFFVNLADNSSNLDNQNGGFTVFARVTEGMDVVDAIAAVAVDANSRPLEDVLLISARRE